MEKYVYKGEKCRKIFFGFYELLRQTMVKDFEKDKLINFKL